MKLFHVHVQQFQHSLTFFTDFSIMNSFHFQVYYTKIILKLSNHFCFSFYIDFFKNFPALSKTSMKSLLASYTYRQVQKYTQIMQNIIGKCEQRIDPFDLSSSSWDNIDMMHQDFLIVSIKEINNCYEMHVCFMILLKNQKDGFLKLSLEFF